MEHKKGEGNMSDYSKNLSANIAAFRKAKGFTQESLAEQLNITFQAVSKWENGQSSPDIMLLPQLADIFDVTLDQLFGKSTSMPNQGETKETKGTKAGFQEKSYTLPWEHDGIIRGVVFQGHHLLQEFDDMSQYTFYIDGPVENVISYCNLASKHIQGNAVASNDIMAEYIQGGANAGANISCQGDINSGVNAGANVSCHGDIQGAVNAGVSIQVDGDVDGNINVGSSATIAGDVSGDISSGASITIHGDVDGDVECHGNLECDSISGNVYVNQR